MLAALGKTDFGLYGGGGGMTVMAVLAFTMRLVRGGIAAVDWENGWSDKFFRMGWEYYVSPACAAD